jgi:hypothetical protein
MKSKTKVQGKRKRNPLTRSKQLQSVPRPRVYFNGTHLKSVSLVTVTTTTLNQGFDYQGVSTDNTFGISRNNSSITGAYQEYKYNSLQWEWIPRVAPGVADGGSTVYVAYIDNPESIKTIVNGTTFVVAFAMVVNSANMKTFNAWERFTYKVPLTYRKKLFNVNTNLVSTGDIYEIDRTFQGLIITCYQSISAAIVLGQARMSYQVELHTLQSGVNT